MIATALRLVTFASVASVLVAGCAVAPQDGSSESASGVDSSEGHEVLPPPPPPSKCTGAFTAANGKSLALTADIPYQLESHGSISSVASNYGTGADCPGDYIAEFTNIVPTLAIVDAKETAAAKTFHNAKNPTGVESLTVSGIVPATQADCAKAGLSVTVIAEVGTTKTEVWKTIGSKSVKGVWYPGGGDLQTYCSLTVDAAKLFPQLQGWVGDLTGVRKIRVLANADEVTCGSMFCFSPHIPVYASIDLI